MTEVPDAEHDASQTSFLALRTILADAASRGPQRDLRLPSTSRDTNYCSRKPLNEQQIEEIVDDVFYRW